MTPTENYCYRHPDRQSFVLCQRCTRTVCGECQTPAPVGVICPECMRADHQAQPRRVRKLRMAGVDQPIVTYVVMGLCALVFVAQWFTASVLKTPYVDYYGTYSPIFTSGQYGVFEPWRMLTSAFLHGGLWHLLMNLLSLWLFGRVLEPMFGRLRYSMLLLVSALGGSFAVSVLAPTTAVIGASGMVFGLIGAWFVVMRRLQQDVTPMIVLIGLNIVVAFMNPGISWEAHLGGAITGVIVASAVLHDHERRGTSVSRRIGLAIPVILALAALFIALPPVLGSLLH